MGDAPGMARRHLLAQGTRLLTMGSLGALFASLGLPAPAAGQDWATQSRVRHQGGHGTVKSMEGAASAAGRALAVGGRVNSGEEIRVAPGSLLILSLLDNTIMRINAGTVVTLEIGKNRMGLFRLLVGSLLTVMPKGNRYLAMLPTAVIGIKGTVFFQQIFHPGERVAQDETFSRVTLPEGIQEYFCLCTGLADYMTPRADALLFSDRSEYHNSYYIDPRAPNPMVKAPQLNHTDDQIRDLIQRQVGEKHNTGFLDAYTGGGEVDP